TFVHAKAAVADMWLVLFVTLAHWAGYELFQFATSNSDKSRAGAQRSTLNVETVNQTSGIKHRTSLCWWLAFYFFLALGFLEKGPFAWPSRLTATAVVIYSGDRQ